MGRKLLPMVFVAVLLLSAASLHASQRLTGCASHTPPFVLMKNGVGVSGFSADYFMAIAKGLCLAGEIRDLPWAR